MAQLSVVVLDGLTEARSSQAQQIARTFETILEPDAVTLIPSVLLKPDALCDAEIVDASFFVARNLRPPLLGEVGCALAHLSAYRVFLQASAAWCLVLEDDCWIQDPRLLVNRIYGGALHHPDRPTVISLFTDDPHPAQGITGLWGPLRVAPQRTLAYLINRKAAECCLQAQTPIRSVADWPLSPQEVDFFVDLESNVLPAPLTLSTIDPRNLARIPSLSRRLQRWSFIWYLKHRSYFRGPMDYFQAMLAPRILRRFPSRLVLKHA